MKELDLYLEKAQEMRRELTQEQERLNDRARQVDECMQFMDALSGLLEENKRQQEEIESLQQQLEEKKNDYEVLAGTAKNLLDAVTEAIKRCCGENCYLLKKEFEYLRPERDIAKQLKVWKEKYKDEVAES